MKRTDKMPKLFETALVEKRNILNEIRNNNMTLQELRFFGIYLSMINARDISTRKVRFPLTDFQKIMGIGTDMNIPHFRSTIHRLLQQIVEVPNENRRGYTAFQLFKECVVDQNEYGEWYVEIDAHDKALPLMFDFKKEYFTFKIENELRLKSPNQIRIYELLKQYEKIGKLEISIEELRSHISIEKNDYIGRTGWSDFKRKVIDSCQEALSKNTDICFTYERGKTGKGGKWLTIIFHINKNEDYIDRLTLDEFIAEQPEIILDEKQLTFDDVPEQNHSNCAVDDNIALLSDSCNNEFTRTQMEEIFSIISTMDVPEYMNSLEIGRYHFLQKNYKRLNAQAECNAQNGKPIKNRYAYFIAMLKKYESQEENNENQIF